ncbi:hypothetical protein ACEPAF_2755 [Sanghuangporus sanghuang]
MDAALDLFDDIEAAHPTFDRSEYATCSCQEHDPQIWELSDDPLTEWITMVYNFLVQAVKVEIEEKWIGEQLTLPDLLLIQSNGFLDFFSGRIYSTAVVATKVKQCWDIIDTLTPADDSLKSRMIADCHLEAYCSCAFRGSGDENRRPDVEKQVNAVQDEICREAFIWKPLKHPNVLPFLGICTDGFPSIGLVSPFMDNGNMLSYIKRKPDIDKLEIMIHGDLKCANILVDDAGRPQIADFGLAQAINIASATASTGVKGTLRWQAPELVYPDIYGGDGRVNTKTDMYAFGMTCLEIFKEDIPFREKTDWEVVMMARDGVALERALEMTKGCSWVSTILERCCSLEPDFRSQATDIFPNGKLSARLSRPEDTVDSSLLSYSNYGPSLARLMRGGK